MGDALRSGLAEESVSLWQARRPVSELVALGRDLVCDVCVIGAGIAGLTTAYLLARTGRHVVVLEQGSGVAAGQTGRTTAHLTCVLDDRFQRLETWHGQEGARLAMESHKAGLEEIERIARYEGIDCGFGRIDGYLFAPPLGAGQLLDRELAAARRTGLAVEMVRRAPLDFDTGPALRFPEQAEIDPLAYCAGLAAAIRRLGSQLFGSTRVDRVSGGRPCQVHTSTGAVVTAQSLVLATNRPIDNHAGLGSKQVANRTYVIIMSALPGMVQPGLYWDTCDPYHYVRVVRSSGRDLIMVGGEDHPGGQWHHLPAELRWDRLETWTRARFVVDRVLARWSGEVMEPVDGLSFVGRSEHENVYVVSGDSGNGLTHGSMAGMLLRDLISGRSNPWAALYDPGRRLTPASWAGVEERELLPGEGAVARHGLATAVGRARFRRG